jgi:hypothetical protein
VGHYLYDERQTDTLQTAVHVEWLSDFMTGGGEWGIAVTQDCLD